MVLCATSDDGIEFLDPPADAPIGELLTVVGEGAPDPDEMINTNKKKHAWKTVMPDLKTNDKLEATFQGKLFMSTKGPITVKSLAGVQIS